MLGQLTAIVSCNQADDGRPHVRQHEADPALIKVIDAPRDGEEVVAVLLPDDMGNHRNAWDDHTEQQIDCPIAEALGLARNQGGTVGVHDNCQATEDTHEASWHGDVAGNHDLDFHIAEASTVPPGAGIVIGPE